MIFPSSFYSLIWDLNERLARLEEKVKDILSIPLYGIVECLASISKDDPMYAFYSLIWDLMIIPLFKSLAGAFSSFYSLIWDYVEAYNVDTGTVDDSLSIPLYGIDVYSVSFLVR